ncbi:MAG: SMP-30/gluconolactonase/LRE family protein [Rhodospirillales bacterium]|nr:SMP-30/gluconolactonase/LRE family protein [Rhodospirillales bacterium]
MITEIGPVTPFITDLAFPEDPRWYNGHFYFSDMLDQRVCRIEDNGAVTTLIRIEDSPSGLGFLPSGDMLVVSMYHEVVLRVDATGTSRIHADLRPLTGAGINDMAVDREGRAYVVQFGEDPTEPPVPSPIILVQRDGKIGEASADGLLIGNGIRITEDGETLVVAESAGQCISLFDIARGGTLSNRRVVQLPPDHFPDGICLDSEGGIWVSCLWLGVIRMLHSGEVTHRIKPEGDRSIYACMYGGPDRGTLYLCTGGPYDNERARVTRAGRIDTVVTGFRGAGLT